MLNLGVVFALGYGGQLAISHTISNGQIIASVNYMIQITTAMIQTVNIITSFSRAITSSARVQAVLDEQPAEVPTTQLTTAQPADSSLINLLTRSFDEYSGQIEIGGVDIQRLPLATVHQQVAVALQGSLPCVAT